MSEFRDGYEVEPLDATDVQDGWRVLFNGEVYTVTGRQRGPARREGEDRQLRLYLDRAPYSVSGEETQTVYRVLGEASMATARPADGTVRQ